MDGGLDVVMVATHERSLGLIQCPMTSSVTQVHIISRKHMVNVASYGTFKGDTLLFSSKSVLAYIIY